jgi:hypothetical protein
MPHPAFQQPLPASGSDATEWALDTLFGSHKPEAWIAAVTDPDKASDWQGARYKALANSPMVIDPDAGHYVCIALLVPGEARHAENVEAVTCAVLDDVGKLGLPNTKLDEDLLELLPEATFTVETSAGNSQVFFAFDPPASAAAYERFADDLKRSAYGGGIRDGTSLVRYVRLPSGKNPKPGRGKFETRLTQASGEKFSLEELRQAFGLGAGMGMAGTATPKGANAKSDADAMPEALLLPEDEALALVREIMALIPNKNIGREDWIGIAFAIWNASGENEDSYDVFLSWTATRVEKGVDPDKDTKDVWDHRLGTKAGVQTLIKHLGFQQTPAANAMIERIKQIQARSGGVFEAVPGAGDNSGDNPAGTDIDIDAEAIDDAMGTLAQAGFSHEKQEVIVPGFVRGEATLVAGPTGTMKSLLMAQLSVAIISGQAGPLGAASIDYCGSVVFYSNEDAPKQLMKRLDAIRQRHGLVGQALPGVLSIRTQHLLTRKGEAIVFNKKELAALMALAAKREIALIVVDTLAAAVGSKETNDEFQQTMNLLKPLAAKLNTAIAVTHHFRKSLPGKDDEGATSIDAIRGGSSLGAAARLVLMVERPSPKQAAGYGMGDGRLFMRLTEEKNSYNERASVRWFKLETMDVAVRDKRDGSLGTEKAPTLVPINPNAGAAWLVTLQKALADIGAAQKSLAKIGKRPRWMKTTGGEAESITTITGLGVAEAGRVLDELETKGAIRRSRNTNKREIYVEVVDPGVFDPLEGEEDA